MMLQSRTLATMLLGLSLCIEEKIDPAFEFSIMANHNFGVLVGNKWQHAVFNNY